ncbi:MAG: glycosyltransferase family 4 protein [Candidatus Methanoperedens sp.]|nr:glycosyltransferase family 4 protein [Candidatus Methanoperedens sp.]
MSDFMKYKIMVLASGGYTGFSHVHEYLLPELAKKHDIIDVFNTRISGLPKLYNSIYSFLHIPGLSKYFHPLRILSEEEFSNYYYTSIYSAQKKSEISRHHIEEYNDKYDIIFQTTWQPPIMIKSQKPHFIFEDFTVKQADREYPEWTKFISDKSKWIKLETETYQKATAIFTVSDHTRNSIINDYNIDESKVITTYNGVNLKELPIFEKDYSNKTILFVGIEFNRKGGPCLIKAFREVKKEIKDAQLVIVGSNPKVNMEGVSVKGYVDYKTILQLYKNASIFSLPSLCEPFGIAFLEAMAYKTPCIGTNVDAMPEIIEDGITGYLVEPDNHKQLAEKLILLLGNEKLMSEMGEAGRKRVETCFTWDTVVQRISKKFDDFVC